MPLFHCYSDASVARNLAGYGIIVVCDGKVVAQDSGVFPECDNSLTAELMAMTKALLYVPTGAGGTSFSDQYSIHRILSLGCKYYRKYQSAIGPLLAELSRTQCAVHYVPRRRRTHHYWKCDEMASAARYRHLHSLMRRKRNRTCYQSVEKPFGTLLGPILNKALSLDPPKSIPDTLIE